MGNGVSPTASPPKLQLGALATAPAAAGVARECIARGVAIRADDQQCQRHGPQALAMRALTADPKPSHLAAQGWPRPEPVALLRQA